MSTLTKEQVMARLEKILTLAKNKGATEAEMNTAMAKATALAREHGIDLASVTADGEVKVEELETDFAESKTKTRQEQPYHMFIISVLMGVFHVRCNCGTYTDHNCMRYLTRITWIGEKTDVALAAYCWTWLEGLFPKCWLEYRKAHGIADNYISKRSYYRGLRDGIISANERAEAALPVDLKNRFALVLVKKTELVEKRYNAMFPGAKPISTFSTREDHGAKSAGYSKGQTIKLNGGLTAAANRTMLT